MIKKDGEIRLIDFGYSTIKSDNSTEKQRFCGTPYYFPPEFILKKEKKGTFCCFQYWLLDFASDLWSLGVLFYKIMYDIFPFSPDTADKKELWKLILNGAFSYPKYSKKCDVLFLNSFLILDPAKRIDLSIALNYLKCILK